MCNTVPRIGKTSTPPTASRNGCRARRCAISSGAGRCQLRSSAHVWIEPVSAFAIEVDRIRRSSAVPTTNWRACAKSASWHVTKANGLRSSVGLGASAAGSAHKVSRSNTASYAYGCMGGPSTLSADYCRDAARILTQPNVVPSLGSSRTGNQVGPGCAWRTSSV